MSRRILYDNCIILCIAVLGLLLWPLCAMAGDPDPDPAEDTTWQSAYEYSLETTDETDYIRLKRYTGSESSIVVPATATIDGRTYRTCLGNNPDTAACIWGSGESVVSISFEDGVEVPTDLTGLFYNCTGLVRVDLHTLDVSKVMNMSSMFRGCSSLTEISWFLTGTPRLRYCTDMFRDCGRLEGVNAGALTMEKVLDSSGMFYGCQALGNLDLSGWDLIMLREAEDMFYNCSSLEVIQTPIDVYNSIDLPAVYFDQAGTIYQELPKKLTASIAISRKLADASQATVQIADQYYTGKAVKPTVKVIYGGKVLSSAYYTVVYRNNKNVGTAQAIITFTGIYTGSITKSFQIRLKEEEAKEPAVSSKEPAVSSKDVTIKIDTRELAVKTKNKIRLKLPKGVTPVKIVWTSSNKKAVTIKPAKNGLQATIKVKQHNKKVRIVVKLYFKNGKKIVKSFYIRTKVKIRSLRIKGSSRVKAGKSVQLRLKVKPVKYTSRKMKWTCRPARYGTVSKNGRVRTKKKGKNHSIRVTVQALDGSNKKATFKIRLR